MSVFGRRGKLHLIEGLEPDPINVRFSIRPSFVRWSDIFGVKDFFLAGLSRFCAEADLGDGDGLLGGGSGVFQFGSVETRSASGLTLGTKVDGRP
jgi:hypothetical protein